MKPMRIALAAGLLAACTVQATAAPAVHMAVDYSTDGLMDATTAAALLKTEMPVKLAKLYPTRKWGFLTQVEGGFDDAKVCVITARAVLLPRRGKLLLWKPERTTTAFGSKTDATRDECRALARRKLGEAVEAMRFSLLGT